MSARTVVIGRVIGRVAGMGRVLVIVTLLLSSVAALGQQDPGSDLGELMRQLAARRHGEVSFVEQHFLKLLKRPAESYGELTYDAPDRLEKRTVEPKAETLTLAGDVLTVVRGGRARTLDLKAYPTLAPFIESIRATLAGDLPSLERLFTVDFAGTLARWRLTLTPRDVQVGAFDRVRLFHNRQGRSVRRRGKGRAK